MKKLIALSLALLLLISLAACGGEPATPPEAPTQTEADTNPDGEKTVTVSTIAELASAIGNDTKITLKEGRYNFSELQAESLENRNLEFDSYSDEDGNNLVTYRVSGVSNLAIEAEPGAEVEIVTEAATAPVLCFEYCSDITVKDLLCGHAVEPGYCTGGVIEADNSKNINIEGCRLYGCGTYGVEAYYCKSVHLQDTQIYECTYGILNFSQTSNVTMQGCEFYSSTGNNMLSFYDCWDVLAEDCRIHDNVGFAEESPFITYDGSIELRFVNCEFVDNYPEVETVDNDYISFANCTVSHSKPTDEHIGYASISEVYEDGDILIGINEVIWIDPSDEDLMWQYDISYEDMTNDYAIVDEDQTVYLYLARMDTTSFSILTPDPTYGSPVSTEVSSDEFIDAISQAEEQTMLVRYTLDENEDPDDGILASIAQVYVP